MRLSALLFALGLELRWSAAFDRAFKKKIKYADRIIVIRTRTGLHAGSFVFSDGRVTAPRGAHPEATVELVWDDVPTALSAMLSKNQLDTFSAIGRGQLTISGNLQDALWFTDVVA